MPPKPRPHTMLYVASLAGCCGTDGGSDPMGPSPGD
jgi:hypothetical protein